MNYPSPLKPRPNKQQSSMSRVDRSPHLNRVQNDSMMMTPDKNVNRSPFVKGQNSSSSKTIKPKLYQRQHDIVSRIYEVDEHSPMTVSSKHLTYFDRSNDASNLTLISRITELEMQLRKTSSQKSILDRELDITRNEVINLKRKNGDKSDEIQQLRDQIKDVGRVGQTKHMDEINKLHSLLKEKNNVILQWTNRYLSLEKKYEHDLKSQQERGISKRIKEENSVLNEKENLIEILGIRMQEADDVIAQTRKSFDVRSVHQEKEISKMSRQLEGLQMMLGQAKEQVVQYERDRNSWVDKYESLVQQRYNNLDENKEKLIEIRTINQMMEIKCKELKEEKQQLYSQLQLLQSNDKSMIVENQQIRVLESRCQDVQQEHQKLKQISEQQLKSYELKIQQLEQKMIDQDKQIDKQDKESSILRNKLNESETKQRQLEMENEKLNNIRQENQKEIDMWNRKAVDTQNEYQMRLEELTRQFEAYQGSKKEQSNVDMNKYYDEQLDDMRSEFEGTMRSLRQQLMEKDEEVRDQAQVIDQLERDNFESKVTLDKKTDQILKLQLALQQFANYDIQAPPSREFSFQNDGEAPYEDLENLIKSEDEN